MTDTPPTPPPHDAAREFVTIAHTVVSATVFWREQAESMERQRDAAFAEVKHLTAALAARTAELEASRDALRNTTYLLDHLASFTEDRVTEADVSLARHAVADARALLAAPEGAGQGEGE